MTDYNLGGEDTAGLDINQVDSMFKNTDLAYYPKCSICNERATNKIMPKSNKVRTAYLQDKGYICDACLNKGLLDSKLYGIRKLEE